MAAHGIDPEAMLQTLPVDAQLPWDHIDVGLEDGFLAREYRKALKDRLSPPCGKVAGTFVHHTNVAEANADSRRLVCYDCGIACDMTQMRGDRVVKLRVLGAEEPRERPVAPEAVDAVEAEDGVAAEDEVPTKRARRQLVNVPLVRESQGERMRIRLQFEKLGRFAYHGHLDLVRLFPRMFRRLDLPLYYSEGFHPRPEMTFSPALSLGIAGLGELMDLKLREGSVDESTLPALLERLNGVAFDGVRFTGGRVLGAHDPSLAKVITDARWVAAIPRSALPALGFADETALLNEITARVASDDPLEAMRAFEEEDRAKRSASARCSVVSSRAPGLKCSRGPASRATSSPSASPRGCDRAARRNPPRRSRRSWGGIRTTPRRSPRVSSASLCWAGWSARTRRPGSV